MIVFSFLTIVMKARSINYDSNSFQNRDRKFLASSIANSECRIFFTQFRDLYYLYIYI